MTPPTCHQSPIGDAPTTATLRAELEEVRRLRSSGMTYEQIAQKVGRSVYWVHSRLKSGYQPNEVRTERLFQEGAVVPHLLATGHAIVAQCERSTYGDFVLEADVVSMFQDATWITEVKLGAKGHEVHTAIGQLVLHRSLRPDGNNLRLQIAIPAQARPRRVSDSLLNGLRTSVGIEMLFVHWDQQGTNR